MDLALAAAAFALVIIAVEAALWKLFSRKISGLIFPREADASYFRFFSMRRVRFLVILHTLFLLVVTELSLFALW